MISINWHEIPFVRISLPFIAGILTQQAWMTEWPVIISVGLSLGCIAAPAVFASLRIRQYFRTAAICSIMFGIGAFARDAAEPDVRTPRVTEEITVARVLSSEKTDYGSRAQLHLIGSGSRNTDIIAFIRDTSAELLPRDTVILAGTPSIIEPATNPFAFDFAQYYGNQGIALRMFASAEDIIEIRPFSGFSLLRTCAILRTKLCLVIEEHIDDPRSRGVLKAMTIGIRSDLDDETYDAYAKSGAIHILAISGLHVGIISFLLFFLFGRVRPGDRIAIKILRTVILLGGIWSFACIAGLSPSVTRAGLMFSLYLIAMNLKRRAQGLNILACTALICLAIDPFQINSLSFQFSYLALLGILIFGKPLYEVIAVMSTIGKFVWGSIVLSISAQVFLIPLMIHYFHQVSLISLLSGIIAIPAAYLIVCGGLLLFSMHYISTIIGGYTGYVLDQCLVWLNQAMEWMSSLPMSHLPDLYLHAEVLILLFILTITIALRLLTGRSLWMRVACIMAGLVMLCQTWMESAPKTRMIAVYSAGGDIGFDYVEDNVASSTLNIEQADKYLTNEIKAFRYAAGTREVVGRAEIMHPDSARQIHQLLLPGYSQGREYRIVVGESIDQFTHQDRLPDCIVLKPGTSYSARKAIESFCVEHDIIFHDIRKQGTLYLTQTINPQPHEKQWQYFEG